MSKDNMLYGSPTERLPDPIEILMPPGIDKVMADIAGDSLHFDIFGTRGHDDMTSLFWAGPLAGETPSSGATAQYFSVDGKGFACKAGMNFTYSNSVLKCTIYDPLLGFFGVQHPEPQEAYSSFLMNATRWYSQPVNLDHNFESLRFIRSPFDSFSPIL